MSKFLIFLAIISTQFACQKLSNALDSAILTCGPSIDSGLWIKLHPGEGLSLPTDLKAVGLMNSSDQVVSLALTEKGCVQVDDALETVVVSSALTKFGAVYSKDQGERDITLMNIGDLATARSCSDETFTNEKLIPLPLRLNQPNDETLQKGFRVRVSIQEAAQGTSIEILPGIGLSSPLDLASLDDGRYFFNFLVSNYFSMVTEKHQCVVTVDHQRPTVVARYRSLKEQTGEHVFLQPAENLYLDVQDASQVSYCLVKEEKASSCEEFLPYDSFITVPYGGYWTLLYKARDKAGNESDIKHLPILAYDLKGLENINLKATLSSLYTSEGRYAEALIEAIAAERARMLLGSDMEQEEALPKVQESLLNAMARIRLKNAPPIHRNRVMQIRVSDSLPGSGYRFAAVDFDHVVKILNQDGQFSHELKQHSDTIKAVEFFPGSFDLITAGNDGKLIFWNGDGSAHSILSDHQGAIHDVAIQKLSRDDQILVASASADKSVRIWDRAGRAIQTLPHDDEVTAVNFGADGNIYSGDKSGALYFWNSDFTLIAKIDSNAAHNSAVYELAIGQDQDGAKAILSAAYGEALKVWTGRGSLIRTLEDTSFAGYPTWINGLHSTEACPYLAIASGSEVVLLDRTNLNQDTRFSVRADITAIAINHRCDRIAVGDSANQLSLWTLKGGSKDIQLMPDYIYDVRFDKSDKILVVGRQDNHLGFHAVESLIPSLKTDKPFGISLNQTRMNAKGDIVVSASQKGPPDLWNLRDGMWEQRSFNVHEDQVEDVQLDESDSLLLTMHDGVSARLWDLRTGELTKKLDHDFKVSEIKFLRNSPFIVTGAGFKPFLPDQSDAGEIRLWNREGELLDSDRTLEGTAYYIEEHPSLDLIAAVDKNLKVYRVEASGKLVKLSEFNGQFLSKMKWLSLAGREPELVISDSRTLTLLRLDNDRLRPVFSQAMEASIRSIEVSPDGSMIAVSDENGNLTILNRDGTVRYRKSFGTHAAGPIVFDQLGSRLAFTVGSGKFAVLNVDRGTIQTLGGHSAAVINLQFAEDGRLMSADEDGYVRLWSFRQEKLLREACDFIRQTLSTMASHQDLCKAE